MVTEIKKRNWRGLILMILGIILAIVGITGVIYGVRKLFILGVG